MRTTTSRSFLALTGAGLVLTLAACSGGDSESSSAPEPGPLEVYFEDLYSDWDSDEGQAQMMRAEEIAAECMAEQGFEYIPQDTSGGASYSSEDLDVEWGSAEFAEQYGYGITTDPWGTGEEEPVAEEEWVDPNAEYVEAMSQSEQDAYYAALYGTDPGPAEGEEEEWEYDWELAGCQGLAQHEVYEGGDTADSEKFAALEDEMTRMWEATEADPRLSEASAEWASCMADAGYPGLAAVGDAEEAFYEELNAIQEEAYGQDLGEDATAEEWEALDAAAREAQSELTPREIETAVADVECRDEVGYTEVQTEVNHEHQQEFVDAHKADLDAYVEHVRESMG
ncbi:hypothetical protein [Actinotalea sp. C106]|uniref:hypothetical protein n=1 Tax=Actinotalea sp. C106 TaxID=2908644 RepID=UPI0020292675|nr:hypothetical protein [Actinotalea sp. C106]